MYGRPYAQGFGDQEVGYDAGRDVEPSNTPHVSGAQYPMQPIPVTSIQHQAQHNGNQRQNHHMPHRDPYFETPPPPTPLQYSSAANIQHHPQLPHPGLQQDKAYPYAVSPQVHRQYAPVFRSGFPQQQSYLGPIGPHYNSTPILYHHQPAYVPPPTTLSPGAFSPPKPVFDNPVLDQQKKIQQPTPKSAAKPPAANDEDGTSFLKRNRHQMEETKTPMVAVNDGGKTHCDSHDGSEGDEWSEKNTDSGMNESDALRHKRTRKRLSVSCRTCRKKKIKCDRQRPICGSCVKNNIPTHLCIYEDSPWVSSLVQEQNLHSHIETLKAQHKKLLTVLREEEIRAKMIEESYEKELNKVSLLSNIAPAQINHAEKSLEVLLHLMVKPEDSGSIAKLKNVKIEMTNFSTTIKAHDSCKTFGPLTWQNFKFQDEFEKQVTERFLLPRWSEFIENNKEELSVKDSLTLRLFEYKAVFPYTHLDDKKLDKGLAPSKNSFYGRKLQDIANYLPSYKLLERKLNYFFDIQYYKILDPFFDQQQVLQDFRRIFKKSRKGRVEINVYDPTRKYEVELSKLSLLLLLIKFGLVFGDDDDPQQKFEDTENIFVRAAISTFLYSNSFTRPSILLLNALLFLCFFKILNPDDLSDELFPQKASYDLKRLIGLVHQMMMLMGLWRTYDELDDCLKDPNDPNGNYLTRSQFESLWKSVIYADVMNSTLTGSSLTVPDIFQHDRVVSNDFKLRQGVYRGLFFLDFAFLSGHNCGSIGKVFQDLFDYSQQTKRRTRYDIEQYIFKSTEYFLKNFQEGMDFWKEHHEGIAEIGAFHDYRLIFTFGILEATLSLNYLLYFSYSRPEHQLNGPSPISCEQDRVNCEIMKDQLMNNCLLHSVYGLRIIHWYLLSIGQQDSTTKFKTFSVTSAPRVKKLTMKLFSILTALIMHNSGLDEYGLTHIYKSINSTAVPQSLFSMDLEALENACFTENTLNKKHDVYYTLNFDQEVVLFLEQFYASIRNNRFLRKDSKWFWTFQQYYYIFIYLLDSKRKLHGGILGVQNFSDRKYDLLVPEEYDEIQRQKELELDSHGNE